jgi:hypothetical protein
MGDSAVKQYMIDQIRPQDYIKIKAYLDDAIGGSGVDGVYWLPVDESRLGKHQQTHAACAPFYMALELGPDYLAGELLVRSRRRVRCDCIRYADEDQRNWLIQMVDAIFEKLEIIT